MKYSEFMQYLIDKRIPKHPYSVAYLCLVLDLAEQEDGLSPQDPNAKRLRKLIKDKITKLNKKLGMNSSTLSRAIGYDTESRVKWLRSLIAIHQRKGN